MKRLIALIIAVLMSIFVLTSCSNNEQNSEAVSNTPSSVIETPDIPETSAGNADYLTWTYSEWSSATEEEQQACIEEYAIMLLERSGLPGEMDEEQMSEISGYLSATVEMKFMMDKEATLEDLLNDTLASLEE